MTATASLPTRAPALFKDALTLAWKEADSFVRNRLGLALLLVLATAVTAALAPIALKFAIDAIDRPSPAHALYASGPVALLTLYVVLLAASRGFGELRWLLFGSADKRLQRNLSRRLLDHVLKLPLGFHLDRSTGGLNQTLVQGLAGYSLVFNHLIFTLLPAFVEIVLIAAVLAAMIEPAFVALLVVTIAAYATAFAASARWIMAPSRRVSATQVAAYGDLTDSLLNAETVKAFTAEQQINDRYDAALATSEREWRHFYRAKTGGGLLVAAVFAVSLGAAIVMAARSVLAGQMSVGEFVLVNAYMLQVVRPMETLGGAFRDLAYGAAFIEKMTALLARPVEVSPAAAELLEAPRPGVGELAFESIDFGYIPGHPVLNDVSFVVSPGRTIALVGSSGSGKSSLVRLLMRFYDPDRGDIRLNGVSTRALPVEVLRRAIAIVPQDTVLFNNTIAYNIAFGRPGANRAEIEEAARFAHIHDRILAMQDGYETVVGERGLKLSGGEKQRVSIARAMLKCPQLFVFDEATSSLDMRTEAGVLDSLIALSQGMTTLIIAHRLSTVMHADEIVVLDDGHIVERGDHRTLLASGGHYAAMWQAQQNGRTAMAGT